MSKREEARRKPSKEDAALFKAAFDSLRERVAIASPDGAIAARNAAFSSSFKGSNVKTALENALDSAEKPSELLAWMEGEASKGRPFEFRAKDGSLYECRQAKMKGSGIKGLLCWSIQDISEKDKVKRELGALNSELERRIAQRTEALEAESARSRRLESIVREVDERERERLGRDIHDMVGQTLAALAIRSEVLKNRLVIEGSAHSLDAASILDNIKLLMDQTRALSRQLFPVAVESRGIDEALIELAASLRISLGIDCSCRFAGQELFEQLGPEAKINIFRISQEAISNAIKHGKARKIVVSLSLANGSGSLEISNNGASIPSSTPGSGDGIGMSIMKSRAEILGGSLSIAKQGSKGVRVKCKFPLKCPKGRGPLAQETSGKALHGR